MTKSVLSHGLVCPLCQSSNTGVKDSRPSVVANIFTIRRRRVCQCGHSFSTFEIPAEKIDSMESQARRAVAKSVLDRMGFSSAEIIDMLVEARAAE